MNSNSVINRISYITNPPSTKTLDQNDSMKHFNMCKKITIHLNDDTMNYGTTDNIIFKYMSDYTNNKYKSHILNNINKVINDKDLTFLLTNNEELYVFEKEFILLDRNVYDFNINNKSLYILDKYNNLFAMNINENIRKKFSIKTKKLLYNNVNEITNTNYIQTMIIYA